MAGLTPLMAACSSDNTAAVRLLLDHSPGPDLEATAVRSSLPLPGVPALSKTSRVAGGACWLDYCVLHVLIFLRAGTDGPERASFVWIHSSHGHVQHGQCPDGSPAARPWG